MVNKVAITCALITLISLAGLAVLVAWLADKTKTPTFSIPQAAISDFNFSGPDDNRLNATFSVAVSARNRDPRYSIIYHVVVVSVYHSGYSLAYHSVSSPFTQPHGATSTFGARPTARNVVVSDANVARALRNGTKLGLEVRVRAAVRFEVRRWKHRHYTLTVLCDPVVIDFDTGKSFRGTDCSVDRY